MNIKGSLVKIVKNKTSWEDAIKEGVGLLVNCNIATNELADVIIASTKELGPYYVLAPRFALAHTRPGTYNKKVGISLVLFREVVEFSMNEKHNVNLLMTLSAIDDTSHVEILSKVATLFQDSAIVDKALKCKNENELLELFKGVM